MKFGIFDDHALMNQGLSESIKKTFPEGIIVFTCTDRTELFANLKRNSPDILIMDVVAPDVAGLELFEKISRDFGSVKIIAHTALTSPVLVENLLSMNVKGYVNKRQPEDAIIDAIKAVISDEVYVPNDYKYLVKKTGGSKESSFLSEREKEIIQLISLEYTSSQIAEKLHISLNTVENHRKNIFQKLKVKNSAGMVMEASRLGYLS
jgi:DNA-binding NarL/FixJ family response regulator